MNYPDNPQAVSVDFLKKLDADPPGTWLAQPKLDGWRRVLHFDNGKWTAQAKHGSEGALKAMPTDVMNDLQALAVPDGTTLDAEWVGCRMVDSTKGQHTLHFFDVLRCGGEWLRNMPCVERLLYLKQIPLAKLSGRGALWQQQCLFVVPTFPNPGLVDLFQEQMPNPLSEGLVVRRADSKLILNSNKCADNPLWFKIKYRNFKES